MNKLTSQLLVVVLGVLGLSAARGGVNYEPYAITTINTGDAVFSYLYDAAVDNAGNVYVADYGDETIKKVSPTGEVGILAGLSGVSGSADGTGSDARFNGPEGVAVNNAGVVFVADTYNHTIRKITPAGVVTTYAGLAGQSGFRDGVGNGARFWRPGGVAVDDRNNVYVADTYNCTIRKIAPNQRVWTLAGLAQTSGSADGIRQDARFYLPYGLAVGHAHNIYVADTFNDTIRKVTFNGVVTTLAGKAFRAGSTDGTGSEARFNDLHQVAADGDDNVYVADRANDTIRKCTPDGVVTTLAGVPTAPGNVDGIAGTARFYLPVGIAVDSAHNIYVADTYNGAIRFGTPAQ